MNTATYIAVYTTIAENNDTISSIVISISTLYITITMRTCTPDTNTASDTSNDIVPLVH
jgi:hypothetical protein